jgi:hypothetical protein
MQFQKYAKFVIDIQKPKPKAIGILPGEAMSETRSRRNLQIVQNNHGAQGCLIYR